MGICQRHSTVSQVLLSSGPVCSPQKVMFGVNRPCSNGTQCQRVPCSGTKKQKRPVLWVETEHENPANTLENLVLPCIN